MNKITIPHPHTQTFKKFPVLQLHRHHYQLVIVNTSIVNSVTNLLHKMKIYRNTYKLIILMNLDIVVGHLAHYSKSFILFFKCIQELILIRSLTNKVALVWLLPSIMLECTLNCCCLWKFFFTILTIKGRSLTSTNNVTKLLHTKIIWKSICRCILERDPIIAINMENIYKVVFFATSFDVPYWGKAVWMSEMSQTICVQR